MTRRSFDDEQVGEDEEYEAHGEALEIFTLTIPDQSAPRGKGMKGRPIRSWRLPPAAAQQFEESLQRLAPEVRIKVRIYRGDRELQRLPAGDEETLTDRLAPAPPPAEESTSPATPERQHLEALITSIRLAQQRLAGLEAEITSARERRDRELEAHENLIRESSSSMLALVRQHREHATSEQQRAFMLDRQAGEQMAAGWSQVVSNAQHLDTVRKVLLEGVMADRMEKYISIGANVVKGVSESQIGQVLSLNFAASIASTVNKHLGPPGTDGQGRQVRPEDVLIAAAVNGAAFNERRQMLSQFIPLASPQIGQALLLGPSFCLGEAAIESVQELINQSLTTIHH